MVIKHPRILMTCIRVAATNVKESKQNLLELFKKQELTAANKHKPKSLLDLRNFFDGPKKFVKLHQFVVSSCSHSAGWILFLGKTTCDNFNEVIMMLALAFAALPHCPLQQNKCPAPGPFLSCSQVSTGAGCCRNHLQLYNYIVSGALVSGSGFLSSEFRLILPR